MFSNGGRRGSPDLCKASLVLQVAHTPGSTDHPLVAAPGGGEILTFSSHIGDVLSHLELSFARHRALWLGSNKALRHGLIIKRITQVFELSMCLAAVLSSLLGT